MTQDDVIRMGEEAGMEWSTDAAERAILRFARLVAAAEREACAKVAESMAVDYPITGALYAGRVEAAIRARGGDK